MDSQTATTPRDALRHRAAMMATAAAVLAEALLRARPMDEVSANQLRRQALSSMKALETLESDLDAVAALEVAARETSALVSELVARPNAPDEVQSLCADLLDHAVSVLGSTQNITLLEPRDPQVGRG